MGLLEWDARSYDSLPLPHTRWGSAAISRLALTGDETVLDLGCGTGRDAEALLALLPRGRVIAVDGSEQMLEELRIRLAGNLDRVEVLHADLRQPLVLTAPADAALSVVAVHWLPDHAALFRSLAGVLRPGAQLVVEGGGEGNIVRFRDALRQVSGSDGSEVWNFASIDETTRNLEGAGFVDIDVRLAPDPAHLEPGAQFEAFLETVMLGAQLRDLRPEERRPFVSAIAAKIPDSCIDYVRLQIRATRSA